MDEDTKFFTVEDALLEQAPGQEGGCCAEEEGKAERTAIPQFTFVPQRTGNEISSHSGYNAPVWCFCTAKRNGVLLIGDSDNGAFRNSWMQS